MEKMISQNASACVFWYLSGSVVDTFGLLMRLSVNPGRAAQAAVHISFAWRLFSVFCHPKILVLR